MAPADCGNYRFPGAVALAAWAAMTNLGLEGKVAPGEKVGDG
jgi:hypothetical protein